MSNTELGRRHFLALAAATGTALLAPQAAAEESDSASPQYYEWRIYQVGNAEQQARVLKYLEEAALPAWQRLGFLPVGVLTETGPSTGLGVHVLLTYKSPEEFAAARLALEEDEAYTQAAAEYLGTPQKDPAFERIESSFLVSFAGMPQLSPPTGAKVWELREYQSHSEAKARRKIDMFNNGEIPIFRACGFQTVLFGETLVGPRIPNLKYVLASESLDANKESWGKFIAHPDWAAMKDLPEYAETVSGIVQTFLTPTAFSQL